MFWKYSTLRLVSGETMKRNRLLKALLPLLLDKKARSFLEASRQKKGNVVEKLVNTEKIREVEHVSSNTNTKAKVDFKKLDRKELINLAVSIHREKQVILNKVSREKREKLQRLAIALFGNGTD